MPSNGFRQRRSTLQQRLTVGEMDAFLVSSTANVRYLSGFTGSNGMLLVLPDSEAVLFTDPRYRLQAAQETDCRVKVGTGPLLDHAFLVVPAQDYVGQFLASLKEYPQRQKASSFNLDEVMSKLNDSTLMENQGLGSPQK